MKAELWRCCLEPSLLGKKDTEVLSCWEEWRGPKCRRPGSKDNSTKNPLFQNWQPDAIGADLMAYRGLGKLRQEQEPRRPSAPQEPPNQEQEPKMRSLSSIVPAADSASSGWGKPFWTNQNLRWNDVIVWKMISWTPLIPLTSLMLEQRDLVLGGQSLDPKFKKDVPTWTKENQHQHEARSNKQKDTAWTSKERDRRDNA